MPPSAVTCPSAHEDPRSATILAIFSRETGVAPAQLELGATPEEMGIGSLDLMLAVFEIETHFQIDLPPPALDTGRETSTLGALLQRVLAAIDHADSARHMPVGQA